MALALHGEVGNGENAREGSIDAVVASEDRHEADRDPAEQIAPARGLPKHRRDRGDEENRQCDVVELVPREHPREKRDGGDAP